MYVHTPKTGGTTMERSALFADARAHHQIGGHYDISTMMANAQARGISDFLRVTHIRHPCSRFVSVFSYLKSDKCNAGDKAWSESHIGNLTIEEFAEKIRGNEELLDEVHFRPLHQWVFMPGGLFGLDAILCQETWNASIDELSARLQIPPPVDLYSSHALQNSHQSCSQIDENTRSSIEKAYEMDYCIFGYDQMPGNSCPQSELTPSYFTDRYARCVKRAQATLRIGNNATKSTTSTIMENQPPLGTSVTSPTQESQSSRWTDPRTIEEKGTPPVFLPRIFFDHDG